MNIYTIALYLHRIGALGLFVMIGWEWVSLWQMRRLSTTGRLRTTGQADRWLRAVNRARRMAMPFMVALLLSGVYMTATVWGPRPWILVALGTLALMAALLARLGRQGLTAVQQALVGESAPDAPLSAAQRAALRVPALWIATQVRVTLTLGIVFLMTMKPGLIEALLAVVSAGVVGLALGIPAAWNMRTKKEAAPRAG